MKVSQFIFVVGAVTALVCWSAPSAHAWCDPRDLVCGDVVDSNVTHGHDDVSVYNCSGVNWNGRAHVYRIFHDGDSLWITLEWDAPDEDRLHLFLLSDCNQNHCLAEDADTIAVDVPAGDYWIIVDGRSDSYEDYILRVYCGDHPLAVELMSFNAQVTENGVQLTWVVASELNNDRFDIEREQPGVTPWERIGSVEGRGTSSSEHTYTFVDPNIEPGTAYTYRLIAVDVNGARQSLGSATVNAESLPEASLASGFELLGNYPNPFNPSTTIRFDVAEEMTLSLDIFDITGRLMTNLASRVFEPGRHEFTFDADANPSGVYFARLSGATESQMLKMVLMK